ncbi:MAG TPA: NadS family protein [Ignavibacteriales bacterium]|nr:NadS family protein [Ignavibacteriales bacterium]
MKIEFIEKPFFTRYFAQLLTTGDFNGISQKGTKMNDELFNELVASIKEAGQIMRGEKKPSRVVTLEVPDVKNIRLKLNLSQDKFAALLGINAGTLRNWEQGIRSPSGPARILLAVADKHPKAIIDTLYGKGRKTKARQ